MDEQQLGDALRDAAADMPPPAFDHTDVVRTSRRITMRRRSALAGGVAVAVAVFGVGVAGALPGQGGRESTSAAVAPQTPAEARSAAPPEARSAAPPEEGAAAAPRSDAATSPPAPLGPGDPTGCANPQDPALRAVVEEALPEVVGAPQAPTTLVCRPGGERGMGVQTSGGVLSVAYLPPGTPARGVDADGPSSTEPTASGGTVTVSFTPPSAVPGLDGDRIAQVTDYLAPRL